VFFWCVKEKNHFFAQPIPFAFVKDIIEAFYTCVILCNMAVKDRLKCGSSSADASYDFVCTADGNVADDQLPWKNLALHCVQMEEESACDQALEIDY
jgi:arginine deiminase